MEENLDKMTKKQIIDLLWTTRAVVQSFRNQLIENKNEADARLAAELKKETERPNRFAITCRIVRNNGTVDVIQNIIPRIEDNESMTIAIHPAAVVNG